MLQKQRKIIWTLGLLAIVVGLRTACKYGYSDKGTTENIAELKNIYRRGGAPLAAAYTNTVIQKFPFSGRINWNLSLFRNPSLSLSGIVDTNNLVGFINLHSTIHFLWHGKSKDGVEVMGSGDGSDVDGVVNSEKFPNIKDVTWQKVYFQFEQAVGEHSVIIQGNIDLNTQAGDVSAVISEYGNQR